MKMIEDKEKIMLKIENIRKQAEASHKEFLRLGYIYFSDSVAILVIYIMEKYLKYKTDEISPKNFNEQYHKGKNVYNLFDRLLNDEIIEKLENSHYKIKDLELFEKFYQKAIKQIGKSIKDGKEFIEIVKKNDKMIKNDKDK